MREFEHWHDLADIAARMGRDSQTVRRWVMGSEELRAAARQHAGTLWVPASVLSAWMHRRPGVARRVSARQPGRVVVARSAGEFFREAANE